MNSPKKPKPWAPGLCADWSARCERSDVCVEQWGAVMSGTDTVALVVGYQKGHYSDTEAMSRKIDERIALIAAAPDLLSLLQDAVTSFGPHLEGGDDEWLKFSRAAIARATASEVSHG